MSSLDNFNNQSQKDVAEQRKLVCDYVKFHNYYNQVLDLQDCDNETRMFIKIIYLAKANSAKGMQISSIRKI